MTKKCHPPLWQEGIHDIVIEQLEDIFVSPFEDKQKRAYLCNRLRAFLNILSGFKIKMEIWIDGSFCSYKQEPNDIDLIVFASGSSVRQLSQNQQKELATLFDNRMDAKLRYGCDVYIAQSENLSKRNYWLKEFCLDYNSQQKGIARIWVNNHE